MIRSGFFKVGIYRLKNKLFHIFRNEKLELQILEVRKNGNGENEYFQPNLRELYTIACEVLAVPEKLNLENAQVKGQFPKRRFRYAHNKILILTLIGSIIISLPGLERLLQ